MSEGGKISVNETVPTSDIDRYDFFAAKFLKPFIGPNPVDPVDPDSFEFRNDPEAFPVG